MADSKCVIWTKAIQSKGYGVSWDPDRRKLVLAHRQAYAQEHGPIPDGMVIDHLCRNPACVNPEHLEAVSQSVNVRRGQAGEMSALRAQTRTHCPHGHKFTPENTYHAPDGRRCKECRREASRRCKMKKREAQVDG